MQEAARTAKLSARPEKGSLKEAREPRPPLKAQAEALGLICRTSLAGSCATAGPFPSFWLLEGIGGRGQEQFGQNSALRLREDPTLGASQRF